MPGRMRYTRSVDDDMKEVSDQVLADRLAETTRRIEDGEKARQERDELIREAKRREWSQERTAAAAKVSQQAISKRLKFLASRPVHEDSTE